MDQEIFKYLDTLKDFDRRAAIKKIIKIYNLKPRAAEDLYKAWRAGFIGSIK